MEGLCGSRCSVVALTLTSKDGRRISCVARDVPREEAMAAIQHGDHSLRVLDGCRVLLHADGRAHSSGSRDLRDNDGCVENGAFEMSLR